MKFIQFVILLFISISLNAADNCSCPFTDITISSQEEIDNFSTLYPTCTEIPGDLTISYFGFDSNNDGLSVISSVLGNLTITSSDYTNLSGLANLQHVGGNLELNLAQVTSLMDLSNLNSIDGDLKINMMNLENLHGLENITTLNNLYIESNELTTLDGLHNLSNVQNDLTLFYTWALSDISALSNLVSLAGTLTIDRANNLPSLEGLNNISHVGGLCLKNNNTLTSLTELNNLQTIGGWCIIESNSSLIDLDGLQNLTSIDGNLRIGINQSLETLSGLDNLTSINGSLTIEINFQLTNIDALANLNSLGSSPISGVTLMANYALQSVAGLDNLPYTAVTNLRITNNDSLSICNSELICNYLNFSPNPHTFNANSTGCNSSEEILINCDVGIVDCDNIPNTIALTTQQQVDDFPINYPNCHTFNNIIIGGTSSQTSDINNLNALMNIDSIKGYLTVQNTDQLTNLDGLSNLVDFELVRDIGSLATFSEGGFNIINNTSLADISALNSIQPNDVWPDRIFINIENNLQLNNLGDFQHVSSAHLTIDNNDALVDLDGFQSLVTGYVFVLNNENLVSLNGLNSLEAATYYIREPGVNVGGIRIVNNPSLTSLAALENLETINPFLQIWFNNSLTNFSGLENVTSITSQWSTIELQIRGNESLTSIGEIGISGEENLWITDNPLLSFCSEPYICHHVLEYFIQPPLLTGNAPGCNSSTEILDNCSDLVSIDERITPSPSIFPNPTTRKINIQLPFATNAELIIFDYTGKRILSQLLELNNEIDLSNQVDGVYQLQIQTKDEIWIERIVKM